MRAPKTLWERYIAPSWYWIFWLYKKRGMHVCTFSCALLFHWYLFLVNQSSQEENEQTVADFVAWSSLAFEFVCENEKYAAVTQILSWFSFFYKICTKQYTCWKHKLFKFCRALAKFNNGFCAFTARAFQWQVNSHGLPSNLVQNKLNLIKEGEKKNISTNLPHHPEIATPRSAL